MNQQETYKFFNVCGGYDYIPPRQHQQDDNVKKVKIDFINNAQMMSYSKSLKNN